MTILFAGGELGSFSPSDSTVIEVQTALLPGYDPTYARCALNCADALATATGAAFGATASIWLHIVMAQLVAVNGPYSILVAYAGATPVWRLQASINQAYQMQYWDGAAWQNVGAGFSVPTDTQTFDFQLSTTAIFAYVHGTTKDGAAGAFAQVTNLTRIVVNGNADILRFSEMIVADQPTLGYRLQTIPPTGQGATDQWDGSYADVDEVVTNDGTFISTPSAAQVELFAHNTVVVSSVRAVVVTARASAVAGAPQHLELTVKSGGSTGNSASIAQSTAFAPSVGVFATDPATGIAWLPAAVNAMQFGVTSLA